MSDTEPLPPPGLMPNKKLVVVDFLNAHLVHGGISQEGYNMLYRMVEMISAIGKELHPIALSPQDVIQPSTIRNIQWYSTCVNEGCERCRKHFEGKLRAAQSAAAGLPDLEGNWEVEGDVFMGKLRVWRDVLK